MTSVVMQIRELLPFFPFWPHKWRNAFSQDIVRAESGSHLCGHRDKAEGYTFRFMAEEVLADEKDCNKILTFLTYFLIDF